MKESGIVETLCLNGKMKMFENNEFKRIDIMKDITEWEVLTPDGWKDFTGIVEFDKPVLTIELKDGTILTGSESHRVVTMFGMEQMDALEIGDDILTIDGWSQIVKISELKQTQKVYDLVGVNSTGSEYYTNGIVSHNCDEMAFIPNRVQNEFMAGTSPALSATRGKMIVTSTPNGSRDLFAKLWFGTGMVWDKKEYTYVRKDAAKNLFTPLFIPYWIDPSKNNEEWINREKKTLDDPVKWRVEFECLGGDTEVEVYDEIDQVFKTMTLQDMYRTLSKDEIDNKVIITNDSDIILPEEIAKYI